MRKLFTGIIACSIASVFFSCQKTMPMPYSSVPYGVDTARPVLQGEANGSFTNINFVPTVTNSGGYITFTGTSQFYTITMTFPATTGVGHYGFDVFDPGFTATVYDGSNTYYANATYGGGTLFIESIKNGRYSGTFSISGQDAALNFLTVNAGVFSSL